MANKSTSNRPRQYKNIPITILRSNKEIISIVGANMKRLRHERTDERGKPLSTTKVAEGVGCSPAMIQYVEKGKTEYCGISLLSHIADYFGYTLLQFINLQPTSTPGASPQPL